MADEPTTGQTVQSPPAHMPETQPMEVVRPAPTSASRRVRAGPAMTVVSAASHPLGILAAIASGAQRNGN